MSLLDIVIGPITSILERFIPDKGKREEMAHEIAMTIENNVHAQTMAQMEINKVEAAHASIFVAGARPFILWVCGLSLAWQYLIRPIMEWAAFLAGVNLTGAPQLDIGELTMILLSLLGLGGMRSYEKKNGVARSMLGKKALTGD